MAFAVAGYEVTRRIASGSSGTVYEARHRDLPGRAVALKVLNASSPDPTTVERFIREMEALGKVEDPHVVRVHAAGAAEEGRLFVAMELVDGPTLEAALDGAPLDRALGWLLDAARGAAALHAKGIVHRDLKPGNVLVGADGRARVADLGLARDDARLTPLTKTGAVVGTLAYMPPEQARGERAGPPADVFSLGAILYRILTGRPPYAAGSDLELHRLAVEGRPRPVSSAARGRVSPLLEELCLRALARDPARRFPDAATFARELERALAATPEDERRFVRRRLARRLARALAIVALALGALGVAGVLVAPRDPSGGAPARDPAPPGRVATDAAAPLDDRAREARARPLSAADVARERTLAVRLGSLAVAALEARRRDATVLADEAEGLLRLAVARAPGDALAWQRLARVLEARGRTREALACARHSVERAPGDPSARVALGLASEPRDAIAELVRAFAPPSSPLEEATAREALLGLGAALAAVGRHDAASACALVALDRDPRDSRALALLGEAAERSSDPSLVARARAVRDDVARAEEEARRVEERTAALVRDLRASEEVATWDRAIALAPSPRRYVQRGRAYARLTRYVEATRDHARGALAQPSQALDVVDRARSVVEGMGAAVARERLTRPARELPRDPACLLARGVAPLVLAIGARGSPPPVAERVALLDEAIATLDDVLDAAPDAPVAWALRAFAARARGQRDEPARDLARAIAAAPPEDEPALEYLLARASSFAGDRRAAVAHLERVATLGARIDHARVDLDDARRGVAPWFADAETMRKVEAVR